MQVWLFHYIVKQQFCHLFSCGLVVNLYSYTTLHLEFAPFYFFTLKIHNGLKMFCLNFVDPPSSLCSIFFFSIFQGYCSGIFIIKYLISNKALVLSWFTYTKEVLSWFLQIVREMTLHNVFIQTLGEWMKWILLLKNLFSA